jgi:hypothetical protein
MFQTDTCGVIIMPEKSGSYVTKCTWRCWQLGQYIAFVECYFTSSAFVLRACFALSVSGGLTDRQVQALLAPNYRWLDPQHPSKTSIRLDQAPFITQIRSALMRVLASSISFRMSAVMATFGGFPALIKA